MKYLFVTLMWNARAEMPGPGDIFAVRPGESVPVDGTILEGSSALNESALTGESIPVDKQPGDMVSAATLNDYGYLKCQAVRVGEDTALSKIIKMVRDASATKAPIAKAADKVSYVFVPTVIVLAVITIIVWLLAGKDTGYRQTDSHKSEVQSRAHPDPYFFGIHSHVTGSHPIRNRKQ